MAFYPTYTYSFNLDRGFGTPIRCIKPLGASENNAPIAIANANKTTIYEGDSITFNASGSSDSDGKIDSYKWIDKSINNTLLSNQVSFSTTYLEEGSHNIELTVTDNLGATDTASLSITVETKPTYSWDEGEWGTCSGDCGEGNALQTRTVVCKNSSGNIEPDSSCTTVKPDINQSCTASYCEISYEEIESPITGRIWLDKNLGSDKVCISSNDTDCYGDYFQWGRDADGHEKVNSTTTSTIATSIIPAHTSFIKSSFNYSYDWTIIDNDSQLRYDDWSKIDGTGICPVVGFRIPTQNELNAELITNSTDAFNTLKIPLAGSKSESGIFTTSSGYIWSISIEDNKPLALDFTTDVGYVHFKKANHSVGNQIRCIKHINNDDDDDNDVPIENIPPVANAGIDQEVSYGTSVTLDASGSSDSDGTIESYQWKNGNQLLSTSSSFSIVTLNPGIHDITLIVTDNDGTTNTDTVKITVSEVLTYNWISEDWGDCTGVCGENEGSQDRTVTCQDNYNAIVNDIECSETKPSTTQACTASECPTNTITSPVTNRIWMDRNLGATQSCTSSTDTSCYGDYFQWGREVDGHEKEGSSTTTSIGKKVSAGHSLYVITNGNNYDDWMDSDKYGNKRNDELSITDPNFYEFDTSDHHEEGICPEGFRVPTSTELKDENITSATVAFNNLKLPIAGLRSRVDGIVYNKGEYGAVWSNGANGTNSMYLFFGNNIAIDDYTQRADGKNIRCIKH